MVVKEAVQEILGEEVGCLVSEVEMLTVLLKSLAYGAKEAGAGCRMT